MIDDCPRLWEEGIPAQGIRPFKDLTPADWSTTPPVGKRKAYTPANKFANWEVVLRNHLLTGKKRKLNTQPLHNKLRTEYYNVCALDQMHKGADARDAAFAAFLADK